ncbi:MAG: hypothetical protein N2450_05715 [bacterium]|nr:hypothetical protein [bacterium]
MAKQLTYVVTVFTLILFFYSCSKNPTSVDDAVPSDSQQLSELTSNEEANYFSVDLVSEDSAYANELDTAITPLRWGRKIRNITVNRTITFDTTNNDTARVQVTWDVSGQFVIILSTDTITKPFTDRYIREGIFVRTGRHTRYRHLNWRLVRVTATEGQTLNSNEVDIASVQWYRKSNFQNSWELVRSITDPLSYWQLRDSLPSYQANDSIKVEVTVNGSGPFFGQLHFRSRTTPPILRRVMQTMGTNQMVAIGKIPSNAIPGVHHLFVDVMTDSTLHDSQAPYRANIWGMLYRVQ